MKIDFHLAAAADLKAIAENERLAHINPWSSDSLNESLLGSHLFWVATDIENDTLIGHMVVMPVVDQWELLNLVVCPAYQQQGIGRLWMQHLLKEAQKSAVKQIFLEVRESNTAAIALYQKFGFESLGRRKNYYSTGERREDAILMQVVLD